MQEFKPGYYRHFRNKKKYLVIGIAKHSETLEEFVTYISLYENDESQIWIRPKSMFLEFVEHEGKKVPRFEYLGSE